LPLQENFKLNEVSVREKVRICETVNAH